MKRLLLALFILLLALSAAAAEVQHVVVVSIDGLRPAYYLHPDTYGLKIPALRRLVAEGAAAEDMRSVFPTLTYPAHTSMVTGVPPSVHGIFLNSAADPEMKFGLRWYVSDVRVPTIYQVARAAGLTTGLVSWPVTLGAQATSILPEFWRGDRDDEKLIEAISTPGLIAGVRKRFPDFHYDSPPETRDRDLADVGIYIVETLHPDLLLVHIFGVDHAQHTYGLDTPEAKAAVEEADAQVGRLREALEQTGQWANTVLFVVSDHGFAPVSKMFRPAVLLEQAGLMTLDKKGRLTSWKAAPICDGGTCEILIHDPGDAATKRKVLDLFTRLARDPGKGIARVYSPEQTPKLTPDAGAYLVLEAAPGFMLSRSRTGKAWDTAPIPATHGYDPDRPDQKATFIVAGEGIRHARLPEVSILDLAPTIAQLLGLRLPSAEGHVLQEIFAPAVSASPGRR